MAGNNGYTAAELMAMQKDAADRVREMQRRAREKMGQGMPPSPPEAASPPRRQGPRPAAPSVPQAGNPLQEFLGDSDRILILLLLIILSQEQIDPGLMMALIWLIL